MTLSPIYPPLTLAMMLLSMELMPQGYDTTPNYEDINTIDKLGSNYLRTGRYLVWTGASEKTIYGPALGNVSFRAVHDWIHLNFHLGFTPREEEMVFFIQKMMVRDLCNRTPMLKGKANMIISWMNADLLGVIAYHEKTGNYPANQRAYVRAYHANPEKALNTEWEHYKRPMTFEEFIISRGLQDASLHGQRVEYRRYCQPREPFHK